MQRVQNTAARTVTSTSKYEHITTVLTDLHWLPVAARIDFKIAVLTFKAPATNRPSYLHELLHPHKPPRTLRGPAVAIFSVFHDHALRLPGGVSHALHHGSGIPFLAPSLITSTSLYLHLNLN